MNKRVEWIDTLRGVAMLFVVLGHAFVNKNNRIRNYIYSFHMPLFFFISGLTTKRKDIKFMDYLGKKTKAILGPYVFINFFMILYKLIMNFSLGMYSSLNIKTSLIYFVKGYSDYIPCIQSWFLLALFVMDIVFFVLMKITRNDIELTAGVLVIFVFGYWYSRTNYTFLEYWHIDTALIGLIFYYGGYMFMKFIDKMNVILSSKKSVFLILITFPLGYYLQYLNGRVSMNANNYSNIYLFLLSAFLTIFSLIVAVNLFLKGDKLFKGVGIMSIFYLGYHSCLLTPIKYYWKVMLSNDVLTIVTSVAVFLILYPIATVCMKYVPILVGKLRT